MDNAKHLFMVSTPLHLLVAIAVCDALKLDSPNLLFIDQVEGQDNPYLETIRSWEQSPFASVEALYRPPRQLLAKLKHRKATFAELEKCIQTLKPKHIYCGNDRRIEFQYAMHVATELGLDPKGYYLDDGAFTYVGRAASYSFSDKLVDNFIKKLSYGLWWKHPESVGASGWVDKIFVSYPDFVFTPLKQKEAFHLDETVWSSPVLKQYCELLINTIGRPDGIESFDLVLTLPHESIIISNPSYKDQLLKVVDHALGQGQTVAVKYHPRDLAEDILDISKLEGVTMLSKKLPFEAILPMLKAGATVLGDFSTTLISTRLLRPDLKAMAIDHGNNKQSQQFKILYEKLSVELLEA